MILLSEFFEFHSSTMLAACIIICLFQKQDEHIKTTEHVILIKKIHCMNHIIFQVRHNIIYLVYVCEKLISIFRKLEMKLYNEET